MVDLFWRFQRNHLREERGRAHHGLPGAAAPGAVPHSARTRASGWVGLGTGVLGAELRGPHCPVMASALTVLLGCWLAGRSGVWGEPSYPKPTITLIAPEGLILGRNISILCEGLHRGMLFDLNKDGRCLNSMDSTGVKAAFTIRNLSWAHSGIYNCSYHSRSEPFNVSSPSDPLEVVVRAPPDFTNTNIARLGLSAGILFVLGLILAEAYYSRPRGAPKEPGSGHTEKRISPVAEMPAQAPCLGESPPKQLPT